MHAALSAAEPALVLEARFSGVSAMQPRNAAVGPPGPWAGGGCSGSRLGGRQPRQPEQLPGRRPEDLERIWGAGTPGGCSQCGRCVVPPAPSSQLHGVSLIVQRWATTPKPRQPTPCGRGRSMLIRCVGLQGATVNISKPFSQCEHCDSAQGWAARFKRCVYLELLYGRLRGRDVCACVKL